jgi:hypothetical protein
MTAGHGHQAGGGGPVRDAVREQEADRAGGTTAILHRRKQAGHLAAPPGVLCAMAPRLKGVAYPTG